MEGDLTGSCLVTNCALVRDLAGAENICGTPLIVSLEDTIIKAVSCYILSDLCRPQSEASNRSPCG